MARFKMAKALVVPNHKFDQPLFVTMSYSNKLISLDGSAWLFVNRINPTRTLVKTNYTFKRGDVIVLTNSSGQTEHATVLFSTSDFLAQNDVVVIESDLTYTYTTGDLICGYATGWPEGFSHWSDSYDNFSLTIIKPESGGYSGDYCFRGSNDTDGSTALLASDFFDYDQWEAYCYYRAGIFYKQEVDPANGAGMRFFVGDGVSTFTKVNFSDITDWTELTFSFLSSANHTAKSNNGHFRFDFATGNNVDIWIDDVYIEHIRGINPKMETKTTATPSLNQGTFAVTGDISDFSIGDEVTIWGFSSSTLATIQSSTGKILGIDTTNYFVTIGAIDNETFYRGARIEKKNDGYWTFTEDPDLNSVKFSKNETLISNRTVNNNLKRANRSGWGERTTKYAVSMDFTNVAYTFYQKLRKFEEHCLRGGLINLHELNDNLPELGFDFLQGIIKLNNLNHNYWSREKVSFNLTLEEA